MTVMLRKALWDIRWTAFWFAAGGAGYTLLVALFYPMVKEQAKSFESLVSTYPKGLLQALGYTDITTFTGFMGVESLNLFWPIIIAVFATLGGAALVAKEIEDGTSEIWLSIPTTRWKLLLAKMAALGIGLIASAAACAAIVAISAAIDAAAVTTSGLVAMAVVMVAFLFTIAAYSGLLSSLTSSRGIAAGVSLGITSLFYAMWLIGGLSNQWKRLKDFTIFTAYQPQKALETSSVDVMAVGVLLALTTVCVVIALMVFERRDAV